MYALMAVIMAAIAARAWMLFSTPMVPGMNGGYYLVQARALLEAGRLGIPDLPLTFTLHAAFAKVLQWLTGHSLEASILLAVKLADSVLPPLVGLPVFLLGRAWSQRIGRGAWLPVAAAAIVAISPAALFITGDLQKNSLGLVWLAGLVYALSVWMTRHSARNVVVVLAFLGLAGLTHVGVFGVALLLTGLVLAAHVARPGAARDGSHWRVAGLLVGGGLVVALVAGLVLWKFDPARIHRLVGAVTDPADFLENGSQPGRPPMGDASKGGRPMGGPPMGPPPVGGPGFPRGGPMGGPALGFLPFALPRWAPSAFFGVVGVGALVMLWRKRRDLPVADHAVVIGCAATVLALTGPWVQGDMARRLSLIVMIPAVIAGLFALQHVANRWLRPLLATVAVGLVVGPAVPLVRRGGHPIISEAAYRELQTLAPRISDPKRTLVVARHGLEWWTAWTLHTHIAQPKALRAEDWKTYDQVLFIQSKGDGPGFGPGGRGLGRRGFQPKGFPRGPMPGGPPPDFFGGPPPFSPPPQFGPPGKGDSPGRGGSPPMMDAPIPPDAEILHDGPNIKLAKVFTPPPRMERKTRGEPDTGKR
ncbi:MAG: hypothetical protein HZA91_01500 [Verrucomicrobia bacterium]|nr:hypothetical protein [Verrucomicrobiota bacterium]